MSALVVEDVHKSFRIYHATHLKGAVLRAVKRQRQSERRDVLRGLSFVVEPGERVGLIGRNGAGKSTLFRIISRILRPDQGRVITTGRVAPLIELTAGLHPDLTGRENLLINGAVLGLTRAAIRERYEDIVGFAGLEDFMDTPARYFSSGMKTRLGFSIAVHVDANVVLIDEALAVGDLAFQQRCVERMTRVAEDGAAVLFVSHEEDAIRDFCERVVWLEEGRLKEDGPTDEVMSDYRALMQAEG